MRPSFGPRVGGSGSGAGKSSRAGVRLRAKIAPIAEKEEIEIEEHKNHHGFRGNSDSVDVHGVEELDAEEMCSSPSGHSGSRTPSSWSVTSSDRHMNLARHMRSRDSMSGTHSLLTELAQADEPMGITPWCGRCPAQRPHAILPLKPEEVDPANIARLQALEINRAVESLGRSRRGTRPSSASSQRHDPVGDGRDSSLRGNTAPHKQLYNRLHAFKQRMRVPLDAPRFNKAPPPEIRDLYLPSVPATSKFSTKPYASGTPVLQRLTQEEISKLERWMVAHVKTQYIEVSAAFHAAAPKEEHKHALSLKLTTVFSLLGKYIKGKTKPEEASFLMMRLATLPIFCDMPQELIPEIAKEVELVNFSRGIEIFRELDEADGVYVLVRGEVELRSDIHQLIQEVVKEAPSAILPEDIIRTDTADGRLFLLHKKGETFRSRTAMTSFTEEDITSLVSLIRIPTSSLQKLSKYYRNQEAKERTDLVEKAFAPKMRMDVQKCKKHCDAFDLQYFPKSHVIIQEGPKLQLKTARLWLIIEGELRVVYPTVKVSKRGRHIFIPKHPAQTKGPGELLGEEAIFGEPYKYSAVVTQPVKVLSLGIADYLDRFLHRSTPLQRDRAHDASTDTDAEQSFLKGEAALAAKKLDVYDIAKDLFMTKRKEAMKRFDCMNVQAADWQRLMPRSELAKTAKTKAPERLVPRTRPAEVQDLKGLQDMHLCYPRDVDLSPSLQRNVLASMSTESVDVSAGGAAWWHPPLASLTGFHEVSLDRKIASSAVSAERLEAAHRSHAAFGYHVEDATGDRKAGAASPLLVAPPNSAVLLTCGAANLSRRSARRPVPLSAR
mmetsp:Transcript_67683/g.195990  ORF Transcript_67683/g.195990 Transcript_67683/m.195990 type:complete len:834 (-) Transcript_67683:52-2553(-)